MTELKNKFKRDMLFTAAAGIIGFLLLTVDAKSRPEGAVFIYLHGAAGAVMMMTAVMASLWHGSVRIAASAAGFLFAFGFCGLIRSGSFQNWLIWQKILSVIVCAVLAARIMFYPLRQRFLRKLRKLALRLIAVAVPAVGAVTLWTMWQWSTHFNMPFPLRLAGVVYGCLTAAALLRIPGIKELDGRMIKICAFGAAILVRYLMLVEVMV